MNDSIINTAGLQSLGMTVLGLVLLVVVVVVAVSLRKKNLGTVMFAIAGVLALALLLSLRDPARLEQVGSALSALIFSV